MPKKKPVNEEVEELKVFRTKDYTQFQIHDSQPDKRKNASGGLIASLKETDGNKFIPILITKDGVIVDGHRRVLAASISSVWLYFMIVDFDNITVQEFMKLINTTSANWSTTQLINHYGKLDEDYREIDEWLQEKNSSLETLNLFSGTSYAQLKAGAKTNMDWEDLNMVRATAAFIAGSFGVSYTQAIRALKGFKRVIKGGSYKILRERMERDIERGDYVGIQTVINKDLIASILIKTYRKHK